MDNLNLTPEELRRYSRHLLIPEFGTEGQENLKKARVLVVGAGGLGAPLLQYLTASGVGRLGIVDFDLVDESNLQRQVLFGVDDIGKPKAEAARERLQNLNPLVAFDIYNEKLTSANALKLFSDYDLVADGTDNFPTRYLVNDACLLTGIPNVYASIFRFDGQVSVFNLKDKDGNTGPNYRDLFPSPPPPGMVPSCAEGGVLGVLPGIIGSIQASEVIKVLTGIGEPLSGRLFLLDALTFQVNILSIEKDPNAVPVTELMDYAFFCGEKQESTTPLKTISVKEYESLRLSGKEFQLIDVREPDEYNIGNMGALLIPLGDLPERVDELRKDVQVIVQCRSGKRSADAIRFLEENHGFDNLYNLEGGILAYIREVDSSIHAW